MKTNKSWLGVVAMLPFLAQADVGLSSARGPGCLLRSERVQPAEGHPFTLYKLQVERVEFQFVPPPAWTVKYDPNKRTLTLLAMDLDGGVSVALDLGETVESEATDPEQVKAGILERYKGARGLREYRRPIAGVECAGYEFERPIDKNLLGSFRVIQVVFPGGRAEFEMKSSSRKFSDFDPLFSAFLGSFRIQHAAR
ncbi:MAG TPA: hypothetical protein VJW76_05955 [Verrucomicrobiae bacterium]|nr:hypothetical protein [Verrucomicrobiae bacterium]